MRLRVRAAVEDSNPSHASHAPPPPVPSIAATENVEEMTGCGLLSTRTFSAGALTTTDAAVMADAFAAAQPWWAERWPTADTTRHQAGLCPASVTGLLIRVQTTYAVAKVKVHSGRQLYACWYGTAIIH